MNLNSFLKTEKVNEKLNTFLHLMGETDTPLLINSTYEFTDSICENEVMENRTDIFAFYDTFKDIKELIYPKAFCNLESVDEAVSKLSIPSSSSNSSSNGPLQLFQKIKNQNSLCIDLVHKAVPTEMLKGKQVYSEENLEEELKKIKGPLEAVDLVYFFDLMLSKSFRFLEKEPIPNMFYDNIFVHNPGRSDQL